MYTLRVVAEDRGLGKSKVKWKESVGKRWQKQDGRSSGRV